MSKTKLEQAVKILGGQSATARALGVSQPNVYYWLHQAKVVPAEYAIPIELATKGAVTRHDLRPDLYPKVSA